MIAALLIGRKGSKGLPGKHEIDICGKPLSYHPINVAINSPEIDKVYVSTDDPFITDLAKTMGAEIIERPDFLATDKALADDAFLHGFQEIKKTNSDKELEMVVLMFCNSATINSKLIREGVQTLRDNPGFDSAVTVSKMNMWSPLRARKLDDEGLLKPFVPFETFGDPKTMNCDRDSQGDVYYADMSASICRPRCLEDNEDNLPPQKWMGKNIAPIYSEAGCDVDYEYQIPIVEWWVKKHGNEK